MKVIGVDAYKGGWVSVALEDRSFESCSVYPGFREVLDGHGDASVIGVDIPIGFPRSVSREADSLARAFVGPRRSSVFPTPPRSVLEAESYQQALEVCRSIGFTAISQQSFGLGPKILEVDDFAPGDNRIHEIHPEVSFRAMAGQPVRYSKKSWNGVSLRRQLLEQHDIVLSDNLGAAGLAPATQLARTGVQPHTVSAILGHSSTAFTMDVYTEEWDEGQEQATVALAEVLNL